MSNIVAPVATRTGDDTPTLLAGITFTKMKVETHARQTTRLRARFPDPATGTAAARPPDGALRARRMRLIFRPRHLRLPRGPAAARGAGTSLMTSRAANGCAERSPGRLAASEPDLSSVHVSRCLAFQIAEREP